MQPVAPLKKKLGAASGSRCEENNLVMNCQLAWITKLTRWDIGTQTRWMCVCVSARDGNYMFDVLPLYALMCVMNSSGAGVYLSVSLYLSVDSLRSWPSKCQTWFVSMLYSVSIFMCQYDQKEKKGDRLNLTNEGNKTQCVCDQERTEK